jgi:hypothetical protein
MIVAGARSRAVLVRGRQYVVVSPNSRLRVSGAASNSTGNAVQMVIDAGSALFRVDRRETPHFGVQTPYLAAVVRGTTFNVSVNEAGATVQVTEGAVQVSTLDGGASDLILPGMIASVGAGDLYQLGISGDQTRIIRSPQASSPTIGVRVPLQPVAVSIIASGVAEPAVDLAEVTGGLLERGRDFGIDTATAQAGRLSYASLDLLDEELADGPPAGSSSVAPGSGGDLPQPAPAPAPPLLAAPEPAPAPVPAPAPAPVAVPEPLPVAPPVPVVVPLPGPVPVPVPVPLPLPLPLPAPLPEPVLVPVPVPLPDLVPLPEPVPVPVPLPELVPLPEPVLVPVPLPTPVPLPVVEPVPVPVPLPVPVPIPPPAPIPAPLPPVVPLPVPTLPPAVPLPVPTLPAVVPEPGPPPAPEPPPTPPNVDPGGDDDDDDNDDEGDDDDEDGDD